MIPLNLSYDKETQEATFFIDNSSTERFDTCARSAEYYLSRRREGNREKPALKFGGIIHKILQHRYNFLHKSAAELAPELIEVASKEFEKYTPPDGDYRNFAMAVDVINQYVLQYNYEPFEILTLDGKLANEVPFAVPLATIDLNSTLAIWDGPSVIEVPITKLHIVWKGKIDLILKRESRIYGMDHKTTSMMGAAYFQDFVISGQIYGYSWAIRKLTNIIPAGYIMNALGVRLPTKTGKKLEFSRFTVMIYSDLIDEWERDTTHKIVDFIEMARRGYMPKQTKWCAGKYGTCEYHGVCTMVPSMRDVALSTNEFKDVTWDPLTLVRRRINTLANSHQQNEIIRLPPR
jgi:hypothetical protein